MLAEPEQQLIEGFLFGIQLLARHIDGQERQVVPRVLPAMQLRQGLLDHPAADAADQSALLRQGNEAVGGDGFAALGVPTQQGFCAHQPPLAIPLRLVMQLQFLALDGTGQALFEIEAFADGLALAAAALGSTLLASVSGVLVLQATLQEAEKHASTLERDLSASLTSFQPIYEVQRQLQLAASSRELRSALLFDRSGRVLAASDNALVGRNLRQLSSADGLGDLPQHLLPCLSTPAGQGFCQEERVTSLVDGPLPWIGGDHMIRALPTPLALEGLPAFGQQGLVLVVRRQLLPELLSLAQTDGLSGVLNRRAFLETASQRLTTPGVGDQAWVVALIDIDHFKTINDT